MMRVFAGVTREVRRKRGSFVRGVGWVAAVVLLFGACSSADPGQAGPPAGSAYVQDVTSSSAVIAWGTAETRPGYVEYGRTPNLGLREGDGPPRGSHSVALTQLRAGSTYYYRVAEEGGSSGEVASFRTAPEGAETGLAFAVIGDSGDGGEGQRTVAGLVGRMNPDLVLHTGDVVYQEGAAKDYRSRFFAPYQELIAEVPIFPSLGNHDVETDHGAPYLDNFYLPHDNPANTERYYSFDWGNAHFVALDSELYYGDAASDPEEQKAWLEKDLAATDKPWKFVYFHRPPYSSSQHGSDESIRSDLEPVFARHGVDVVFNGHDHDYERTVPIRGVTYVVTGGGGKDLYPAGRSRWTAFSESAHHATRVRIEGDRLLLEAVRTDGNVMDRLELQAAGK